MKLPRGDHAEVTPIPRRVYTAGCVNKMAVSVTGPHAVNELGGPVIPGSSLVEDHGINYCVQMCKHNIVDFNICYTMKPPLQSK